MPKRKTPIEHDVSSYTRDDGSRIGSYRRGQGTRPQRSSRTVGYDELPTKVWGISTEVTHGEKNIVDVDVYDRDWRISPDYVTKGTVADLVDYIIEHIDPEIKSMHIPEESLTRNEVKSLGLVTKRKGIELEVV